VDRCFPSSEICFCVLQTFRRLGAKTQRCRQQLWKNQGEAPRIEELVNTVLQKAIFDGYSWRFFIVVDFYYIDIISCFPF
jgi:hypothetical protein